jgi:[NiFe] hydrogenase maturation protein HypF
MEEVPYDRETTTMVDFTMCPSCHQEYVSPDSRRFHAQTISCYDCGPYLIFQDNTVLSEAECVKNKEKNSDSEIQITDEDNSCNHRMENGIALAKAIAMIKDGEIIAVKGIGGFHMVCSPYREETVQNLRKLKGREEKPFAVMFPTLQQLEDYCKVSKEERALLASNARPIVLLSMHQDTMASSTNKGSLYCGAFLPYTPLQLLLTKECGPLIMTSANLSNQPIIKDDEVMCSLSSPYLSGVLYNKRRIVRTVDDSVAKVIDGKPQLIRRSRGYVPYPVFLPTENKDEFKSEQGIFGAGGDLKAAFCFYKNGSAVVSQYFGDLEEETVMKEYQKSYVDLARLLKIQPTLTVCDYHPNYHSTHFAKELGLPLLQVQHHHAHIASVMAEHDLHEKVIGIAFDGTGYGMDGNIWGGEFLLCEGAHFIRTAHLAYTPMIGGDQSMKDARKTASCYLLQAGFVDYVRDDRKNVLKSALEHKINTILTSSMGRLFDAVASILDIAHENTYEGECAALLEKEAVLAKRNLVEPAQLVFAISKKNEIIELDPASILEELCILRDKESVGALALGFHYALANATADICLELREKYQSNVVALSGGVFQNTVLTEKTLSILRENDFQVYMNMAVPPNDGAISLGQVFIGKEHERLDGYVRSSTR